MNKFILAKVSSMETDEDGREKRIMGKYLVNALSYTECEAKIAQYGLSEYEIDSLAKAKYGEYILDKNASNYYVVKSYFISLDEKTGREKKSLVKTLVSAFDLENAKDIYKELMSGSVFDYEVISISDTKIDDIIT